MQRDAARAAAPRAEFRASRGTSASTPVNSARSAPSPLSIPPDPPPLDTELWQHEGVPQVFETLPDGQMIAAPCYVKHTHNSRVSSRLGPNSANHNGSN